MPRTLPWKRTRYGSSESRRTSAAPRDTDSEPRRRRIDASGDERTPSRPDPPSGGRPPSTSPPPAPPPERLMLYGFDADDRWRMVEDEFHSVAGTFTAHLHKAEYQRLKDLAKTRNADTIRHISRPVVAGIIQPDEVKRRLAIVDLEMRQRHAIKRACREHRTASASAPGAGSEADSDPDEDQGPSPWAGTALQGLMDSPRKRAPRLAGDVLRVARGANSPSRGSINGRRVAPSLSAETKHRHGDGPMSAPHAPKSSAGRVPAAAPPATASDGVTTEDGDSCDDDLDAPPTHTPRGRPPRTGHTLLAAVTNDDDSDDGSLYPSGFRQRMKNRKARRSQGIPSR